MKTLEAILRLYAPELNVNQKKALVREIDTLVGEIIGEDEVLGSWPEWYAKTKAWGGSKNEYYRLESIINNENNHRDRQRANWHQALQGTGKPRL